MNGNTNDPRGGWTDEFDADGLGVDEVDPWRADEFRLEKGAGKGGRDGRKADLQR